MRNVRQMVSIPRSRHSEKPEEVRRRIEAMFPKQTKIELFARRKMDGWDAWGLDVNSSIPSTDYVQYDTAAVKGYRATPTLFLRDRNRTMGKKRDRQSYMAFDKCYPNSVCGLLLAMPRCRYASSVTMRPRGVRSMKPRRMR